MENIVVRFPSETISEIDKIIESEHYGTRSEYLRELVRNSIKYYRRHGISEIS